jgi:hypothetical protein
VLRSKILASGLAVVLACTLTACEKPHPEATVTAGTSSAHGQALCWAQDSALSAQTCAESLVAGALNNPDTPTVKIVSDETLSISVDPKVAELGWYPAIGGQRLSEKAIYGTYYRFTFPKMAIPDTGYSLQIIAQSAKNAPRGIWVFKLVNK